MKALLLTVVCFILALCNPNVEDTVEDEEYISPIIELSAADFDIVTQDHPFVVVEFYAPWCGACKKFAPAYETLAEHLSGIAVFTKFDAWSEENKPIANKYNISGYPTLWFFMYGFTRCGYNFFSNGEAQEFTGSIFTENLALIIIRKARPVVTRVANVEEIKDGITQDRLVILGIFDSEESQEYKSFFETAKNLKDFFFFIAQIGDYSETKTEFNIQKTPVALIFKSFEEGPTIVEDFSTLEHSIRLNEFPILDEIGRSNGKLYVDSAIPILFFFYENPQHKETYAPMLRNIGKNTRLKLNPVFINWETYKEQAPKLGLSGKVVPSVAIEDTKAKLHFVFDETKEITEAALTAWVSDFLEGKLTATFRSQDVPENNNGPVKVVVSKNFNEIVLDNSKDVFLEFYAPWCGHCKKLAPIWDELGKILESHSNIVIAKIDATVNDLQPPYNAAITMFPTLKLYKADDKEQPVEFSGKDRSLPAFVAFLKEHTGSNLDHLIQPDVVKDEL